MRGRYVSCLATALLLLAASCANILGLEAAGDPGLGMAGAGAVGGSHSVEGGGAAGDGSGGEGAGGDKGGSTLNQAHGLRGLTISAGVLEPAFDPGQSDYTVRVGVSVPELTVAPYTANPDAVIQVNGKPVKSPAASAPIPLVLEDVAGKTTIEVVDDNTPAQTYTITVERAAGLFEEAYLKASNARPDDHFGASVALSQSTLAVGAPLEDGTGFGVDSDQGSSGVDNSGAVYVFVKSGDGWTQQAYLKASNPRQFDGFGSAVALSGDVLVVGAPGESSAATSVNGEMNYPAAPASPPAPSSGAVYVFHRVAGHWAQRAYLKASDSTAESLFGSSVGVSGGIIVVGAPGHSQPTALDTAGAAYVFDRLGDDWVESALLAAAHPGARDQFGTSVAVSGTRIVVGAPGESSKAPGIGGDESDDTKRSAGAAYIFERKKAVGWTAPTYVKAVNPRPDAYFGSAVAIDDGLVAVGSPGESSGNSGVDANPNDTSAPNSGAVYVFANTDANGSWEQAEYVKASNAEPGDAFGAAVALGQGVLAVASSGEDGNASGIDGEQKNEDAPQSGAVYLFAQAARHWQQAAYVKASNTEAADHFGSAVAIADGDLAVGAELEDSHTAKDPADNTASTSGAAYVRSVLALPYITGPGARGLTTLELTDVTLDFSPTTFDYQVEAAPELESVTFAAVAADPGAEITLTNSDGNVVDASAAVALDSGDNRFTLHVLATSGEYVSYSVDVRRPIQVTETLDAASQAPPFDVSAGMLWESLYDSPLPVAISGDTLVVGVPYDDLAANGSSDEATTRDTGAVYVFVRTGQSWEQQALLKASNAASDNYFGVAVALSGDTLVVGASGEASPAKLVNGSQTQNPIGATQTGAAYVFVRTDGKWQQQAYLKAFNATSYDYFGETVALDGDRVVVGARGEGSLAFGVDDTPQPGAPSSGAVYVFHRDGAAWAQEAYLKATNTREGQWFGSRVAIFGDTIAVTATDEGGGSSTINGDESLPSEAYGSGAVYTYILRGFFWEADAYIKAPNYHIDVDFGRSLALGTNTLVVGATGDQSRACYVDGDELDAIGGKYVASNVDASLSGNGAVYVFERDLTSGEWQKTAYLKASNSDGQDAFGRNVSLASEYLAVGAPGESSSAPGMPADNAAQSSGAAYLFHRSISGTWLQTSYVKPSTPTSGVGFGCFVGLDTASLAVGNCRQPSPEPFDPKTFGVVGVFQF
jgi:FG-GAP repeat/Cadherin-like beta sandwich domain